MITSRLLPAVSPVSLLSRGLVRCFGTDNLNDHVLLSPACNKKDTPKICSSADEAVSVIQSNSRIFIHTTNSLPRALVTALVHHGKRNKLTNVTVFHGLTDGTFELVHPENSHIFRSVVFFSDANSRLAINDGRADFVPVFLSDVPKVLVQYQPHVSLVHVSPANDDGFHSMGVTMDVSPHVFTDSKYVIAQVNKHMPWTHGESLVHRSHFDAIVHADVPLTDLPTGQMSEAEDKIGRLIAEELVEDGATMQMGIGNIPNSVLSKLTNHRDLGIHTELLGDGVIDLMKSGVINGKKKKIDVGKVVTAILLGTKRLNDFANNNPVFYMKPISYCNSECIIRQNDKVTAINSCLEIDLWGNVCSDSLGSKVYSGFGGQVDFLRGASLSRGGKPILALASTTKKGESKITPQVRGSVTTTRGHVHHVVTEHGIVNLFGKSLRQRAYLMIQIAHPDHRESLEKSAFQTLKCMPSL